MGHGGSVRMWEGLACRFRRTDAIPTFVDVSCGAPAVAPYLLSILAALAEDFQFVGGFLEFVELLQNSFLSLQHFFVSGLQFLKRFDCFIYRLRGSAGCSGGHCRSWRSCLNHDWLRRLAFTCRDNADQHPSADQHGRKDSCVHHFLGGLCTPPPRLVKIRATRMVSARLATLASILVSLSEICAC